MKLRYFYDLKSGVCLWAADQASREAYGYSVDLERLPVSAQTRAEGARLLELFDSSIDYSDPQGPSPWTEPQRSDFLTSGREFFARLVAELGPTFEVLNEMPE